MNTPAHSFFKPGTRELLPATRDAYLQSTLTPADAQTVEKILENDGVERGVALARYHELAAKPGELALPPPWVSQQLLRQASVSAWGPLRRPVVQLGLGLLLLLLVFSSIQWVRNQPLVPVPVMLAFKKTVNSAAQGLGQTVVYTSANLAATQALAEPPVVAPARPARLAKAALRRAPKLLSADSPAPLPAPLPAPAPTEATATAAADSVIGAAGSATALAVTAEAHLVRGHVYDQLARPLAGATVMLKGTSKAAVTDASGAYELSAPTESVFEVGYAGYNDETMQTGQATSIDITLHPLSRQERRKVKK